MMKHFSISRSPSLFKVCKFIAERNCKVTSYILLLVVKSKAIAVIFLSQ